LPSGAMDQLADAARQLVAVLRPDPWHGDAREIGAVAVGKPDVIAAHRDAELGRDLDDLGAFSVGHHDLAVGGDAHGEPSTVAKQLARVDDVPLSVVGDEHLVQWMTASDLHAA